jgi:hypothetical protein
MIHWMNFPQSRAATDLSKNVVRAFEHVAESIDSDHHQLNSNGVLLKVAPHLRKLGFKVEDGKRQHQKISVPVLFGLNGKPEKTFDADAFHPEEGFVLEVEAGRGVINNQFLKDLFQASMMHDVKHLGLAVRNTYRGSPDFQKVCRFFETLFASQRLQLPLNTIVVIGY